MDKRYAVLDSSFWINAHRSGLVDYLPDYFDLVAPMQVAREIEYVSPAVGQLSPAGETFQRWRQAGRIELQATADPVDWFHPGENAAIGLAQERGCILLMDDQAPYHLAKRGGLPVVASADFVVLLYADRRLSYGEAAAALARSEIALHLKRAAMSAIEFWSRHRGEQNDDAVS